MFVDDSDISCGVHQLVGVGMRPSKAIYYKALKDRFWYSRDIGDHAGTAFLIASIPSQWKKAGKFLKSFGFKATRKRKNPNSNNSIIVLIKSFSKRELNNILNKSIR